MEFSAGQLARENRTSQEGWLPDLFYLSVRCVPYRAELVVVVAGPAGSFSLMYLVICPNK